MSRDLDDIIEMAIKELRETMKEGGNLDDAIHEIADSSVPVYTRDLMQLAVDNIGLATTEPDLGAAFDGKPTPANIIAANVYEEICLALHQERTCLEDTHDEDEEARS